MSKQKWLVLCVTPAEYRKADAIPGYAPQEELAGYIEATCESQAEKALRRAVKAGEYPPGSQLSSRPVPMS